MKNQYSDDQLLGQMPDFITVGGLLKASASEEAGKRILTFVASNEDVDHQNEIVLQKALADSSDYFLRHGNIDISHYTILGPKSGVTNFIEYEVGKPFDVQMDGKNTVVKAELYQGDSPMARNADMVWKSLTEQQPPSRWYPSVGGAVLAKSVQFDPATGEKIVVVDKVRWNNVALDRCPVNKTVPAVEAVFAKSLNGFVLKALEAGGGTDVADYSGGAALGREGLYRRPYSYYQDDVARCLMKKSVSAKQIPDYMKQVHGFGDDHAEQFTNQFLTDIQNGRKKK